MKRDKTATRPMSQGFTAVLSFLNCQRRDYSIKKCLRKGGFFHQITGSVFPNKKELHHRQAQSFLFPGSLTDE